DLPPLVAEDLLGEVPGEPVRVVELEEEAPVEDRGARDASRRPAPPRLVMLLDQLHAGVERLGEALLLVADGGLDPPMLGRELGIRLPHELGDPRDRAPEERLRQAEQAA